MAYHRCIELSADNVPPTGDEGENYIIHVQFHGTGRDEYTVVYEKLERSLLTEYLRQRDGPDFHQKLMKLAFNITPEEDATRFCRKVLEEGIFCHQQVYFFLGHSDDQLKKKSCYLMSASHENIHALLSQFGDFLEERNLGKRARNIGMLFSTLNKPLSLAKDEYKIEPKRGVFRSYTLTDECGFMSPNFSSEVQRIFELDYQPSAIQVRYRGIEGMLALKEDLTEVKVQFYESMQKFVTPNENMPEVLDFIDVVDHSRPYDNGYLSTRMIMLLADAGVSSERLEELQSSYYDLLENMCTNTATAEYFLRLRGEVQFLKDMQESGVDGRVKKHLKLLRKQELDEMMEVKYTRILVPKSRVVFAVCDPYGKLKLGDCYFKPTISGDTDFSAAEKIVVARSPCYHPGDVRVFKLTHEKPGYETYANLRDCLVLSVTDPCPGVFECFEGDLGGNCFFVSWDADLIPSGIEAPCDYSPTIAAKIREAAAKSVSFLSAKFRTGHDSRNLKYREQRLMLEYFATFSDEIPKRIEGEFMKCATAAGPSSKECRQLSKMLYQAANFTEDTATLQKELEQMNEAVNKLSPRSAVFWVHQTTRMLRTQVNIRRRNVQHPNMKSPGHLDSL
ncbi:hypothetical protein OS493_000817 [Desmophyllum pertusum]|uniref:RNA-dependent RNA polymerase n=1 Tax=Desmophyllum pertusum TaxID=174260 RepID=A0A9W9ZTA1_9CNID|nr:hypothetical protein OS493_000817 [Desmophyllum pertusum]